MSKSENGDFRMVAKTFFGLEEVLAHELTRLGAKEVEKHTRSVSFVGDKGFMYKANFCLRTALAVLKPIGEFKVKNDDDLYKAIQKLDWELYLGVNDTLAIDCSLNTDNFNHNQYVSQKVKDAIVDQFREKFGTRPSVDLDAPTVRINIHIYNDTCWVALDSSGDSLYKRGYREYINRAPLKEVMAAGLVLLTGWERHIALVDPMCGAGTIPIEAAMIGSNIPAGINRKNFGFETWKDYDADLKETIFNACIDKINSHELKIFGSDISRTVARKAYDNVHEAKVEDAIKISTAAFENLDPPAERGVLIINPPYGERMDKEMDIFAFYKMMGDTFKKKWSGWDCWVISSNLEALKHIGLRHTRKITVFNGQLECRFMKYQIYQGTKKVHKLEGRKADEIA